MADLEEIMENVALANRMLYEMELADASTIERGHVSYRLPDEPDKFVIKGLGPALSQTYAEHMVVVNTEGFKVSGPAEMNLPNEVKMHSCLLRERPEINSVVQREFSRVKLIGTVYVHLVFVVHHELLVLIAVCVVSITELLFLCCCVGGRL